MGTFDRITRLKMTSSDYLPSEKMYALADFVAHVPDPNYNQDCWGVIGECGTIGCAMGWGAMALSDVLGVTYDPRTQKFTEHATGKAVNGFEAAQQAFGITEEQALTLFGTNPTTRCDKVKQLRAFAGELAAAESKPLARVARRWFDWWKK